MRISHVAGNFACTNEKLQPRHIITLLISTQTTSGKVRREGLRNFTFFCTKLGSLGAEGGVRIALCPGFLLFLKVLRTVLWILFLHCLHPSRMGRMLAPSSNRDFLLQWDKAMGKPLFQKRKDKEQPNQLILCFSSLWGCQQSTLTSL